MMGLMEEVAGLGDPVKAKALMRFFRTGKGEYGEGDVFLGVTVPKARKLARKHRDMPLREVGALLRSRFHEHRLAGLLVLVEKFGGAGPDGKMEIFDFYMRNIKAVNNWDLVDLSADKIAGAYLQDKDKTALYRLARSDSVWERRIAIIATFNFIKRGEFSHTLKIAGMLLKDRHDLIHKAVGWMLREVGKRGGLAQEEAFLKRHKEEMPRTMLRYAIERFDERKRKEYMA
jgi:3-methyladenine DNA glycosylase AlkD